MTLGLVITTKKWLKDAKQKEDLAGIDDVLGQRLLRRIPVGAAQEREVLALVERHVVVGEPLVGGVEVALQVLGNHRLQLDRQCVGNGKLSHETNCNPDSHISRNRVGACRATRTCGAKVARELGD